MQSCLCTTYTNKRQDLQLDGMTFLGDFYHIYVSFENNEIFEIFEIIRAIIHESYTCKYNVLDKTFIQGTICD